MFGFDKMFDFNRDGKLDSLERAVQFQFMDDMLKEDHSSSDFDEDEADVFGDAGLDYDELNLWIRMKEEKCWKMQDWIRMSLIFETE